MRGLWLNQIQIPSRVEDGFLSDCSQSEADKMYWAQLRHRRLAPKSIRQTYSKTLCLKNRLLRIRRRIGPWFELILRIEAGGPKGCGFLSTSRRRDLFGHCVWFYIRPPGGKIEFFSRTFDREACIPCKISGLVDIKTANKQYLAQSWTRDMISLSQVFFNCTYNLVCVWVIP